MKTSLLRATLVAGLLAGATSTAWAQNVADAITARQTALKGIGAATGDIKKVMDAGGDLTTVAARGQEIADNARKLPPLFPPGSGQESGIKTRALPALWQNKSDFEANAGKLAAEADKLTAVLKANDKAGVAAQFAATTAVCGNCHRPYRAPQ